MKTLIASISIAFISAGIVSFTTPQTKAIPETVKTAFAKKFPSVKKVDWEKESDSEWEAVFKMNRIEYSANFTTDGKWLETEHEISKNQIPQKIKAALDSEFKTYKIEEAEISETAAGSVYEFELEKGEKTLEVVFNLDGKKLKEEVVKEED